LPQRSTKAQTVTSLHQLVLFVGFVHFCGYPVRYSQVVVFVIWNLPDRSLSDEDLAAPQYADRKSGAASMAKV
jgi:hypothetical protein